MRATIVLLTSLFLIALMLPAQAGHDSIDETGTIIAGTPEILPTAALCDPSGVDPAGKSYDVSGFGGHVFRILPQITLDIDPMFYDENCEFISSGGAPLGFLGVEEIGIVPSNAAYLYVWGWAGTGTFTVKI